MKIKSHAIALKKYAHLAKTTLIIYKTCKVFLSML